MSKFEENLKTAFCESLYDLCMQNREIDPEYQRLEKEYNQLFDRIRNLLGKKHRKLMMLLEELGNHKGSIDDKLIYSQGMANCVTILKIIGML